MNVTFTSGDKRAIRSVMNYFYNAAPELTRDNIQDHIRVLSDKYKGMTVVENKTKTTCPRTKDRSTKGTQLRMKIKGTFKVAE